MAETTSTRAEFEAILRDRGVLNEGEVLTDAVLVAAVERFDSDATGYIWIFPDGHQAWHITQGLLWAALERQTNRDSDG